MIEYEWEWIGAKSEPIGDFCGTTHKALASLFRPEGWVHLLSRVMVHFLQAM